MKIVCDCGSEMTTPNLPDFNSDTDDGTYGEGMYINLDYENFDIHRYQNSIAIECKLCRKVMDIFA